MLKVGLTGSIGSGKSTIAGVFRVLGIPVYLADEEARKILNHPEVVKMVSCEFGSSLVNPDGQIDRRALAAEVFTDVVKLGKLNAIVHPRVRTHFTEWIGKMENVPYILQEAAIMYESGFSVFFDKIIVVAAPVEERIARVIKRDEMTRQEVLDRMDKQWSEEKKLERADYVIFNSEHSQAIPQVLEIHEHLNSISQNFN
ncbi:MAG: dephospho-CoA kinase [Bacteroidales bacterium]|nr:dephospho-CoA kinase [Bacteroidales bacterium]MBK9356384.1 dephospho-CoA kinase [Bacteroidales bacterium]